MPMTTALSVPKKGPSQYSARVGTHYASALQYGVQKGVKLAGKVMQHFTVFSCNVSLTP